MRVLSCSKSAPPRIAAMKWWTIRSGETRISPPSFCCVVLEIDLFIYLLRKDRGTVHLACGRGQPELKTKLTSILWAWCLTDLQFWVGKATVIFQNKDLFLFVIQLQTLITCCGRAHQPNVLFCTIFITKASGTRKPVCWTVSSQDV